ncbi:MAG: RNA pyrophosphohydrolase, partial [Proteobacteria bacterium]|nr:RNA pyrophosphohydrolase [Pseudomonadota bacterium]
HNTDPLCIGQKQKWFLLSLESDDDKVELAKTTNPEFDDWRWVDYWYPIHQVIEFKRDVYRKALQELSGPLNSYIKQQ